MTDKPALETAYITAKQVSSRIGMSVATLYRWMADGKFPKPVKMGTRSVRWATADIEAWLSDQRAAS